MGTAAGCGLSRGQDEWAPRSESGTMGGRLHPRPCPTGSGWPSPFNPAGADGPAGHPPLSSRFLWKQMKTWSVCSCSSANSRRTAKLKRRVKICPPAPLQGPVNHSTLLPGHPLEPAILCGRLSCALGVLSIPGPTYSTPAAPPV